MDGHDIQVDIGSKHKKRLIHPLHIGTAVVLGLPWSAASGEQDGGKRWGDAAVQPAKFVCEELFPTRRLRQPGDRHDVLLPLEPGQAFSCI